MIVSTVAIFLSGILFIYSFKNDLFFKLDTLKRKPTTKYTMI
jgi:hypothetical protein